MSAISRLVYQLRDTQSEEHIRSYVKWMYFRIKYLRYRSTVKA